MKNNFASFKEYIKMRNILIGGASGAAALLGFQALVELFLLKNIGVGTMAILSDLSLKNALIGAVLGAVVVGTKEVVLKMKKSSK